MQAQLLTWSTPVYTEEAKAKTQPSPKSPVYIQIEKQLLQALIKGTRNLEKDRVVRLVVPYKPHQESPRSSLDSSSPVSLSSSPSSEEEFAEEDAAIRHDFVTLGEKKETAKTAASIQNAAFPLLVKGEWTINSNIKIEIEAPQTQAKEIEFVVNRLQEELKPCEKPEMLPRRLHDLVENMAVREFRLIDQPFGSGENQVKIFFKRRQKSCDAHHISLNGRNYIAAAGRLNPEEFWEIVYQNNICLVVKLTERAEDYQLPASRTFEGGLEVSPLSFRKEITPNLIQRVYLIQRGEQGQLTMHLDFTAWPDFGVPKLADFAKLLISVEHLAKGMPGSIMVHCGAGIGRTGTFIAAHSNMQKEEPDIAETVRLLRTMRNPNMVETEKQYLLIHQVFLENHIRA